MATNRPLPSPLSADLPENWQEGQVVAPEGADVGLPEQYGYNYLMQQVNDAQRAANQLSEDQTKIHTDLEAKQDKLTGTHGQVVGFNEAGEAVAQDMEESGVGRSLAGQTVEPTQGTTVTASVGAEIFNDYRKRIFTAAARPQYGNIASGQYAHAEGSATTASGHSSHAEGATTTASGQYAHAEGCMAIAGGQYAHAEGYETTASNNSSHAEGYKTTASGYYSHAEGYETTASGQYAHAEGCETTANQIYAHAEGYKTLARGTCAHASGYDTVAYSNQTVVGTYNVEKNDTSGARFIVGGGSWDARKNAFRVDYNGSCYGSGSWNTSGADYAELFEWQDENPGSEDRAGLFVTLDGDRIRIATPEDDYILGIVSAVPSVVGDVYDDQWAGMYLRDVFGRTIIEEQDFPAETIEVPGRNGEMETMEIHPAFRAPAPVVNPDYDQTTPYQPRTERPEWDAVGLLGKLVAVDDGTCQVNGWATVGPGGVATASPERTKYRVMARLDATHVRVMIL